MKAKVIIEGSNAEGFSAYIATDGIPYGIVGEGATVDEARADFLAAYEEMRAHCAAEGKAFTELEFSFRRDLPSFLQHYAYAFTLAGLSRITGVNAGQLSHYINGTSRPSPRTVAKIQEGISRFAEDLSAVKLA